MISHVRAANITHRHSAPRLSPGLVNMLGLYLSTDDKHTVCVSVDSADRWTNWLLTPRGVTTP